MIMEKLLKVKNLDKIKIDNILDLAQKIKNNEIESNILNTLNGKLVGLLFLEPSSRTLLSFDAAIKRLGGNSIKLDVDSSSIEKGESIKDTIRCISSYVDLLVIRYNDSYNIQEFLEKIDIPILNAGNGLDEHPTQALLDLFTIKENFEKLDNLTITMIGDLRYGRTVHSLIKLLRIYVPSIKFNFISPKSLSLLEKDKNNLNYKEYFSMIELESVIEPTDVLYMTRIQKERHKNKDSLDNLELIKFVNEYMINENLINKSKDSMIIMHPLPRNREIPELLDSNKKSKYFNQMRNGLFLRMALLNIYLGS